MGKNLKSILYATYKIGLLKTTWQLITAYKNSSSYLKPHPDDMANVR